MSKKLLVYHTYIYAHNTLEYILIISNINLILMHSVKKCNNFMRYIL